MKSLGKAMGFRKSDEMDVNIQLRAIRLSWAFGIFAMAAWHFYEMYVHGGLNGANLVPGILLTAEALIYSVTQIVLYQRVDGGERKGGRILFVLWIVMLVGGVLAVGFFWPHIATAFEGAR